MQPSQWTEVDRYFTHALVAQDDALTEALAASAAAGLPAIQVTAAQGKLLQVLARACGSRRILEIGTLGAYSTIWLARALPAEGHLVTLELDPHHASVARENLIRAGVDDVVELRQGPALESLAALAAAASAPFDFIFIDADKPNNPHYLRWAKKLSRPGTLVVVDNVVRGGAVTNAATTDANALGVRQMVDLLAADGRVDATIVQTVGEKGWDGLVVGVVR